MFDSTNPTFKTKIVSTGYKIIVTYGGGMGGASETLFFELDKVKEKNKTIIGEDISGRKLKINKSFIPYFENVNFVKVSAKGYVCYIFTPINCNIKYECNSHSDNVIIGEIPEYELDELYCTK